MRYRFADCIVDQEGHELYRSEQLIPLRRKAFLLLCYLLEHRDRVVSREELLNQIWPGKVVSETTLTTVLKTVRQALGDDGQQQQIVRTVRGEGYRFIAPLADPPGVETGAAKTALGQEYKQVSVLCAGVSNPQALAQRWDAEQIDHFMHRLFALAETAVERYQGTVIQWLGHSLLAVFGAPRALEETARLALLAALELRASARRQAAELPLAIGQGIHSGAVLVSGLDTSPQRPYTAIGQTTDLALRLQQHAAADTIVISQTTHELVAAEVQAQAGGEFDSLAFFLVNDLTRRVAGVPRRRGYAAVPLVGRGQELRALEHHLRQAADRRGCVVSVSGEPGIGKSRLLDEFLGRIASDTVCLRGQCLSYAQTTPYLPLADLLRQHCAISVTNDAAGGKLSAALNEAKIAHHPARALLSPLLDLPDDNETLTGIGPQQRRAQTFAYLRQLLAPSEAAAVRVLVIEDLHWIDPSSAQWLAELIKRLADLPVLLLLSHRSDWSADWLAPASPLPLPPLRRTDGLRLVDSLAEVSAAVADNIVDKAQGNPFFIEELTRTLAAQNEHDAAQPVPDTVYAVLASRIDRLPDTDKRLLQTAAVIGSDFTPQLLGQVDSAPADELTAGLGRLRSAKLVSRAPAATHADHRFNHALTQEVAYASLSRQKRRALHSAIAAALTRHHPHTVDTRPEFVAHHFEAAGEPTKAAGYWQQAGQRALLRSAAEEAEQYFRQSLTALAAVPETPQSLLQALALRLSLGAALITSQGYATAAVKDNYDQASMLYERLGQAPQSATFSLLLGLWMHYCTRGELPRARRLAQQLADIAERTEDPQLLTRSCHAMGVTLVQMGEFDAARPHLQRGIACYDLEQQRPLALQTGLDAKIGCLAFAALASWLTGHPRRALAETRALLAHADALQHPFSSARAQCITAIVHQFRGDATAVARHTQAAIKLATERGFTLWIAVGTILSGWALVRQGDSERGLQQMQQGLAVFRRIGMEQALTYLLGVLADAYLQTRQVDAGLGTIDEALQIAERNAEHSYDAELYRLCGEFLLLQTAADEPRAARCFRQAIAVAERQRAEALRKKALASLKLISKS